MKNAAMVLAVVGVALSAFGWWGLSTDAGQHRFDEMDGIIPVFAGFVGTLLVAAAAVLALFAWRRSAWKERAAR